MCSRVGWNRLRAWLLALAVLPALSVAGPVLRCQIDQGYKTYVQDFLPSDNPYRAEPMDVRGRFRFKAVVYSAGAQVDYVKLYAYYFLRGQPVLIHMAQHDAPAVSASPDLGALTGLQRVYSPRLGHEMRYQCALREAAP